jgi:hypothetical protein
MKEAKEAFVVSAVEMSNSSPSHHHAAAIHNMGSSPLGVCP